MGVVSLRIALAIAVAAAMFRPAPAEAIYIRHDVALSNYAALASDPLYAATGYLRTASGQFCTGTLVSPTVVLSAAHCFVYTAGPNQGQVASPSVVMFGVGETIEAFANNAASLVLNPGYNTASPAPDFDMALLTLSTPILNLPPAALFAGDPLGIVATIVGYGGQGTGVSNGLPGAPARLAAQNVVDVAGNVLRYDFDSPDLDASAYGDAEPLFLEGTTATGDSGGPMYLTHGSAAYVVGTLFGGIGNNFYGDRSFYASVARQENLQFLLNAGLNVLTSLPETGTPVPEPGTLGLVALGAWLGARRRRRRTR